MRILVVGAGLIGTVYGAHLGAAGEDVSVLAHGGRTTEIAERGLRARDVLADETTSSSVAVVDQVDVDTFDLVLVALRRENLESASTQIGKLSGSPLVLFFDTHTLSAGPDLPHPVRNVPGHVS